MWMVLNSADDGHLVAVNFDNVVRIEQRSDFTTIGFAGHNAGLVVSQLFDEILMYLRGPDDGTDDEPEPDDQPPGDDNPWVQHGVGERGDEFGQVEHAHVVEVCGCGCKMIWSDKHNMWLCLHCDLDKVKK